jgi:hypothetical protein
VVIAAQEDGSGIGRIRMRRIADASAENLEPFITENIESGSVIHTDGWQGYAGVSAKGFHTRSRFSQARSNQHPGCRHAFIWSHHW